MAGYHVRNIEKGVLGHYSKVIEEAEEFLDACEQECKIMALVELSDMIGAIKEYLRMQFPGTTLEDLEKMATITKRAFDSGHR